MVGIIKAHFKMIAVIAVSIFASGCLTCSKPAGWEYKVIPGLLRTERETVMNELGQQGWMLVTVDANGTYYFKRASK